MKKIFSILLTFFVTAIAINAQPGGGFQRRTPEQRVAAIHEKLDSAFKLEASKFQTLDTALTVLYRQQETKMREMFSGGERPDRETMMAERKKYADAQDEMMKAVLTEEQFAIWKEKIEPSMRPQRQGGDNRN